MVHRTPGAAARYHGGPMARCAAEDWLLLSTDHGRTDDGGHGDPSEQELTIFYLASGGGAAPEHLPATPEIVDVAVTALAHLGIAVAPEWELDGRVSGIDR